MNIDDLIIKALTKFGPMTLQEIWAKVRIHEPIHTLQPIKARLTCLLRREIIHQDKTKGLYRIKED